MILNIIQILVAILLIGAVLIQARGSGLSTAFGGSGEMYRSRRSTEKFLMYGTIVLGFLFAVFSIILLLPS